MFFASAPVSITASGIDRPRVQAKTPVLTPVRQARALGSAAVVPWPCFGMTRMNPIRILETNHTAFTVTDLDQAIRFFREALGFELISREPREPKYIQHLTGVAGAEVVIAYVRGAGHLIELFEYSGPGDRKADPPRPCDAGANHICFFVESIEAAVAAAKAHGMEPIASPVVIGAGPNRGGKLVYLRGAGGIYVEFIEPPTV